MQYYKNSMRYVKIFLVLTLFSAIGATFFFNQINSLMNPKKDQTDPMQQALIQQAVLQNVQSREEQEKVPTEKEYVKAALKKYKEANPDITREKEIEVIGLLRNQYRQQHNMPLVQVQYAPESMPQNEYQEEPQVQPQEEVYQEPEQLPPPMPVEQIYREPQQQPPQQIEQPQPPEQPVEQNQEQYNEAQEQNNPGEY